MANRSAQEMELLEKARRYLPGGNNGNLHHEPERQFLLQRGLGSHVWDVSGKEYIDYLLGSGPMVLGHSHPAVVEAVSDAMQGGSTFFATNDRAVLLAEQIVEAVPCAEKVRFTTSGTDATFQAMRVARAFRRRDKILKFEGGFHGSNDYALMSVTPGERGGNFPHPVPNSAGIPKAIEDLVLIAPFNDTETTTQIIEEHHDELACVIMEPMQRVLAPKPGFLQAVRDITAHHQIPLIFDEVVTGFRLAYGGAQEFYGVTPDMATVGKIVGGGFPLAAVTGRDEIMAVYDGTRSEPDDFVSQVGTLNGNHVACAAGLATLAELRKPGTYERIRHTGRRLREALETLCAEAEIPALTTGEDPTFDIYFMEGSVSDYRSTLANDRGITEQFNVGLLERGVLKGWPSKFYVSLAHTDEDVDRTIEAFAQSISEIRR